MKTNKVSVLSPFEIPDIKLALNSIKSEVYSILHLGRNTNLAQEALDTLSKTTEKSFGVCYVKETPLDLNLPSNVDSVIFPFGVDVKVKDSVVKMCQIHSIEEANKAIESGITNLIIKGNEGAGKVADESSFILFQKLVNKNPNVNLYIQGGVGLYSSAAFLSLGAKGVILDSQISLFRECSLPDSLKQLCEKLGGNETQVIDNYRILLRKNSPKLPVDPSYEDILPHVGSFDLDKSFIPMGQDIALSSDLAKKYKTLKALAEAIEEKAFELSSQAKSLHPIRPDNSLAKSLGIKYPIAQGPMARVSDVPRFAYNVSDSGALPFLAMSMTTGEGARNLVDETAKLMDNKSWGVGILGFIPAEIREEQTRYILKAKPTVVLIAGGRPSLSAPFEKAGIKTFIHVPSPALLDMFIKEGAKSFIFEGRESGGHIGPLLSLILWEKQITRLLKEDDLSKISVFFAGGIHDDFSTAFVSIMSSSLSARGAKVGVLMGSAYLYTKEAVESGAIHSEFQKRVVDQDKTVILEAAQGQETRAIDSPFTTYFQTEKASLQKQYTDTKQVWLKLEELNLGRLRIAAKGIERIGTDFVKLNADEIGEKGLFMIGQVASMHNEIVTMEQLHKTVAVDNNKVLDSLEPQARPSSDVKPLDVAIVGISGIFPDAHNIEEYWRNIITNKNSITEVPDSRWNKDLYYRPETKDTDYVVSKWGGFIPTMDFDPVEFGMTPQSLSSIEPVQLLSLYAAKQALSDAGYKDLNKVDLENTSVIFGAEGATELASSYGFRGYAKQVFGELPETVKNALPRLTEDSFAGVLSNVISGRIANRLNLGGRNYTVDAACASSLAALDVGCQELYSNRSDMVILGGADFHNGINDFLMFSCTHALSKKGYSASFDSNSDGIALGEGIGVLVLKRLEDAERDGNKIYAVIKGIGGSSDGKSLGMTAPNRTGQAKALTRAYKSAGILPLEVGMIEAHGTGTVVGDRTELKALTDMFFESGAVRGQALLGSVKTQIGHAKCAAGIAGVIKTALSLHYAVHPPILHLNNPNPFYDKETSPFVFNTQAGIWNSEKRVAGVSSFGFGGTNFHVVMENYKNSVKYTSTMPLWPSELFVFRGESRDEALQLAKNVKELLSYNNNISIKDIAYTLAVYNQKTVQLSIVASDSDQLLEKINAALSNKDEYGVYFTNKKEGKVAFMFSGQGSQRVNMARDLFVTFAPMRKMLEENKEYQDLIFPYATFDEASKQQQQKDIMDTRNTQPLLGIVDYAIADYLRSIGIVPDMLAGHSYGELPALCFSGVIEPQSLVYLSKKRAISILDAVGDDTGQMIAVTIPKEELDLLLSDQTEVWAVNYNSHKQTVLAGSTPGIKAFTEILRAKKIAYKELNVACAFHSPLLAKSESLYKEVLDKVPFGQMSIPVWSNTTSEIYPDDEVNIKERLCKHLVKPVRFVQEIENMHKDGATIFIETGPGSVLCNLVQSILGDKAVTIQTDSKGVNGVTYLMHSIAKYIATGKEVKIEKLFDQRNPSVLEIDTPAKYQKKSTIWYINGHNAVPANGKMPATGAYPITQPLPLQGLGGASVPTSVMRPDGGSSDEVILEYLDSMKSMLQAQRDVMLGYLGASVTISNTEVVQKSKTVVQRQALPVEQTTVVTTVTSNTVSFNPDEIKTMLLDIVSEKTGYPSDMLGLELDLEADLSIDSIKRMEIIGAIQERLNISGSLEEAENAIEKIAAIKTLNGMIAWMQELANSQNSQNQVVQKQTISATSQVVATTAKTYTREEIKTLLLDVVSDKTGYPTDMLGLDLDLEADLSIDSIKRMEIIGAIQESLNISGSLEETENAIEKIAAIKSLNGMIDWMLDLVKENTEKVSQTVVNASSSTIEVVPVPVSETKKYTKTEIKDLLLDVVSDKTGYPTDMLGLDLDLEADLSIDSIKRMEIIGAIQERLNISGSLEETEDAIENIARIKTLNGMIAWMDELANGSSSVVDVKNEPSVDQSTSCSDETSLSSDKGVERMSFVLEERFFDTSNQLIIDGMKFAVTDDEAEYSELVKKRLEAKGAIVDIIKGNEELTSYDGLIILNSIQSPKSYNIQEVLRMIKSVDLSKIKWIYSFSDLVANVDTVNGVTDLKNVQGFPGLIKSLAKEYPNINFRACVFRSFFEKETLPQIVLDEILTKETVHIEIIYKKNQRFFLKLTPSKLDLNSESNLQLDNDSVVIAFGGAQGITPELLTQLSREYPCTYILVGRTEMPTAEYAKYQSLTTQNDIRKYLITQEGMRSPGEVEKKTKAIYKANQILNNINKIAQNGSKVIYKTLDVKNENELRSFIKEMYQTYGRIDGIVHAAGLLDDKLFANKSIESFKNVYDTKVIPLRVLLEEIRPDLKVFVLFSSVASSFGNRGQTDYASANSVFDLVASRLSKKIDARIVSINWGPWKGAGMVSDSLEAEFNRRGISLIPLTTGAQYFVNELKYGRDTNVLVMGGIEDIDNFLKNA